MTPKETVLLTFPRFFSSWGDFFRGVKNGIIKVVEAVTTAVKDAVKAAITFTMNAATYVWNGVANFVKQVGVRTRTSLANYHLSANDRDWILLQRYSMP
jgi:phage-related protein